MMDEDDEVRGELAEVLSSLRGAWLELLGLSAVISVLQFAPMLYMMQILDRVTASHNFGTLFFLAMLLLVIMALLTYVDFVRTRVLIRVGNQLDVRVCGRAFDAAFERSLHGVGGNAALAITDIGTIRQFLTGTTAIGLLDAPWSLPWAIPLFMINWAIGMVFVSGIVLFVFLAWITEKVTAEQTKEAGKAAISAGVYANNNLRNVEVIEALGMLPAIRQRWNHFQGQVLYNQTIAADRSAGLQSISKTSRMLFMCSIMTVGVSLNIAGGLSSGLMMVCMMLMGRALIPIDTLITSWKLFIPVRLAYDRLDRLLKDYPARTDDPMKLPPPLGEITAENVTICPPGSNRPVIKNVGFTIRAGDVVGIIGPSASGKSTLGRALVGVWRAQQGVIRLDGHDIFKWDKSELGPHLGYMPQDVELFEGTVGENIARLGEIDPPRIIDAAMRAGVHDMVVRLPDGYDTKLSMGGGPMSGGQCQRIALARSLYGNPSLVVLDEPNANLDEHGENALIRAINDLKRRSKTVVVITHRTSILNAVDKLMLLNDGVLQLYGPRDQVLGALMAGSDIGRDPASALAGIS